MPKRAAVAERCPCGPATPTPGSPPSAFMYTMRSYSPATWEPSNSQVRWTGPTRIEAGLSQPGGRHGLAGRVLHVDVRDVGADRGRGGVLLHPGELDLL